MESPPFAKHFTFFRIAVTKRPFIHNQAGEVAKAIDEARSDAHLSSSTANTDYPFYVSLERDKLFVDDGKLYLLEGMEDIHFHSGVGYSPSSAIFASAALTWGLSS